MDHKLKQILQGAAAVQAAVVKFRGVEGKRSFQAKIVLDTDETIHCVLENELPPSKKIGKKVHLIQKHRDDYFFIAGHVSEEAKDVPHIFSVTITRAFWFVRKRKGSVTWLREKYTYNTEPDRGVVSLC